VDERESEYILAHTGPGELDGHPLGGCGSGFGLVPGYTTLSVRVRVNIQFGTLKIKSVRTNVWRKTAEEGGGSAGQTRHTRDLPVSVTGLQTSARFGSPYQNLVRRVTYTISDFGRGRAGFWKINTGKV